MEQASSSKTIGASTYSMSEDGKLTILVSGQHQLVYEPKEALELLQWLYAYREWLLGVVYPTGMPDWAQEGKTSAQDTDPRGLGHALEQKQQKG